MEVVKEPGKREAKLQTLGDVRERGEWLRENLQASLFSLGEWQASSGAVDIVYEHEGKFFVGDASIRNLPQYTLHYCLDDQSWYARDEKGRLARLEDAIGSQ